MNLQRFDEAANAFYEGVLLSPESKELIDAFRFVWNPYDVWVWIGLYRFITDVFCVFLSLFYREAVDAGRKFHGKDKIKDKS